ncbi:MAG: GIY-YIG nuclease family protein [Rubripirellula sp.]
MPKPQPQNTLRLIKRCAEDIPIENINQLAKGLRGIYVLYNGDSVVYVGMATTERTGIRGRLKSHRAKKSDLWSYCSVFEVWENVRHDEIAELEGLFRHIYRCDPVANKLNKQRGYRPLKLVTDNNIETWT